MSIIKIKQVHIIITTLTIIGFLFFGCIIPIAYSTDEYSIDVPDSWSEDSEGNYNSEKGDYINIQIIDANVDEFSEENFLSENTLNYVANYFNSVWEKDYEEYKEALQDYYSKQDNVTEEQIDKTIEGITFEGIKIKEITTFTRNNYDCILIRTEVSSSVIDALAYNIDQYATLWDGKVYILTADGDTDSFKDIVDTFTIKGRPSGTNETKKEEEAIIKEENESSFDKAFLSGVGRAALFAAISLLVGGVIGLSKNKRNASNGQPMNSNDSQPKKVNLQQLMISQYAAIYVYSGIQDAYSGYINTLHGLGFSNSQANALLEFEKNILLRYRKSDLEYRDYINKRMFNLVSPYFTGYPKWKEDIKK